MTNTNFELGKKSYFMASNLDNLNMKTQKNKNKLGQFDLQAPCISVFRLPQGIISVTPIDFNRSCTYKIRSLKSLIIDYDNNIALLSVEQNTLDYVNIELRKTCRKTD